MAQLITDDGVTIHYSGSGAGKQPVICLHFMGGNAGNYQGLAEALSGDSDSYCVAIDFRGHGASQREPSLFTNERLARDVLQVADAIGAERFVLAGHSSGGKVALQVAALAPARVEGLVLLGAVGPGLVPFERAAVEEILLRSGDITFLIETFRGWFKPGSTTVLEQWAESFRTTPLWAHRAVCEIAMWTDLTREIGVIDIPALVVVGEHDPVYGIAYQQSAMLPALAHARLEIVNCGHELVLACPTEIAALCRPFLGSLRDSDHATQGR